MAWLQVAAGFMLFFNTWGMINTFAVFQTYYESGQLFKASSSEISWIGSIQCFLLQLTGIVAGPVYDRGHLRLLLVTGSFLVVVVAMPPVCFRMLTKNPSMIGTHIGQGFAIGGLGLLIGGPSGGAVLGTREPLEWTGLWLYGGLAGCVAAIILGGVRIMKGGLSLKVKV